MADNNTLRKDLGPVTAYAIAVEAGFEGTQEEWVRRISASVDQQSFDTLAASVESGDAALSARIDTETEALSDRIDTEAETRTAADTNLSGQIDTLSETVTGKDTTLRNILVHKPVDPLSPDGTVGQVLTTNGDGTTKWTNAGQPTDAQASAAVEAWLTAHPEATTTVQDGAISRAKLDGELQFRSDLVTNSLAPFFSQSVANDAGTYVIYGNKLYRLPNGHEADATWENTTKVEVQTTGEIKNLGDDVTSLKSALTDNTGNKYISYTDGAYIYTDGAVGSTLSLSPTSASGFSYAVADVSAGDVVTINGTGSGNAYLWTVVDSSNVILSKSAINLAGNNLKITMPENAAKVVINSTTSAKGKCYVGEFLKDRLYADETELTRLGNEVYEIVGGTRILQQNDLLIANSNFVVRNGSVYAINVVSPYNSLVVASNNVRFKYRRRSASNQLFIGVCIDGKFVGNVTNSVVTGLKTIYGTTNVAYTNGIVNVSVADNVYNNDYYDFTATINGQIFELKKGSTTIFKFTINNGITIQGVAILNYKIDYVSSTDNTDIKNYEFDVDRITERIVDAMNPVAEEAQRADIIGLSTKHRMVAGVIRNTGNGWEFIIDTNHQGDLNCVSVSSNASGQIVIDYSAIAAKKIISLVVCPDEAFAFRGYICGSSVGRNQAYVEVYKYLPVSVYAEVICANDGTISIGDNSVGVSSATWDSTTNRLKINHDAIGSTGCPVVTPAIYSSTIPRIYSSARDSTTLQFLNIADGSLVTEVTNKMSFRFQRTSASELKLVKQDANEIVASNGDFWFIGIFEV